MSEDRDKQDKQRRIAELEAELAALRTAADGAEGLELLPRGPRAARTKIIVLAVAVIGVALAVMLGLFTALSSGFDSLANKAATLLTPGAPDGGATSAADRGGGASEGSGQAPRVPGL